MRLTLVAAMDQNHLIGKDGHLPWPFLPDDHAHVLQLIEGKKTIMGRKSYDTPDRIWSLAGNIVVTSQENYQVDPGFEVVSGIEEALERYQDEDEVIILGGGHLYAATIDQAECLELTLIHAEYEGDTYFPNIDEQEFELLRREDHASDAEHAVAFSFLSYQRK
ncbi:MAG: dihydrofolate reductase [Siphonobacter sp.]